MLDSRNVIFNQIQNFLKHCTKGTDLLVYNSAFISHSPEFKNRVEYKVDNVISTGHNYSRDRETENELLLGGYFCYKGQLEIRVIDEPQRASGLMSNISNKLNHFNMRDNFMPSLSIHPHTMRVSSYPVKWNGTLYNIERIIVEIDFILYDEFSIDWFNKVIDTKVIINNIEEVI